MLKNLSPQWVQGAQQQNASISLHDFSLAIATPSAAETLLTQTALAHHLQLALAPLATQVLQSVAAPTSVKSSTADGISARANDLLLQMLISENEALLVECLRETRARQKRLPLALLPALLRYFSAANRQQHITLIRSEGVQWLAQLNPQWQWALDVVGNCEQEFEQATGRARLHAFLAWRAQDADNAREQLQSQFQQCSADERAALINAMQAQLSDADESFLESVLDDRAKTVRQAAAALLSALPASALAQRSRQRCQQYLQIEEGFLRTSLRVELPDAISKIDERDGIDSKTTIDGAHSMGPRQSLLAQIIALTPLSYWMTQKALDWPAFLNKCREHEFALPICAGLAMAAARQQNLVAIRSMLDFANDKQLEPIYRQCLAPLLPTLPQYPELVLETLQKTRTINIDQLQQLAAPWPPAITAMVMEWLQSAKRFDELIKDYSHYSFVALTKLASTRIVANADHIARWPTIKLENASSSQKHAQEAIDDFVMTMQTRIHFLNALEAS